MCFGWGGRIRTLGMSEPESDALPLGDTPIFNKRRFPAKAAGAELLKSAPSFGWGGRIRTLGMVEPESTALPLGDTPISVGGKWLG